MTSQLLNTCLVELSNDISMMSPATACAYVRATNCAVVAFKLTVTSGRITHAADVAAIASTHLPSSFHSESPHPVIRLNGLYCHPSQLCACASAASAAAINEAAVSASPA